MMATIFAINTFPNAYIQENCCKYPMKNTPMPAARLPVPSNTPEIVAV